MMTKQAVSVEERQADSPGMIDCLAFRFTNIMMTMIMVIIMMKIIMVMMTVILMNMETPLIKAKVTP